MLLSAKDLSNNGFRKLTVEVITKRHIEHLIIKQFNDNDNDNEIDLFRHHNGNNTNIKVIFKQVTMLDKCNCI